MVFLEGKAVDKDTERVIEYQITDKKLILDNQFSFEFNDLDWYIVEKDIKLINKNEERTIYSLHFFTTDEAIHFLYAVKSQTKPVQNKLGFYIQGAIDKICDLGCDRNHPRDLFPFKEINSSFEVLSYLLFNYFEAPSEDDKNLVVDFGPDIIAKCKDDEKIEYYQIAASFLSMYLPKYNIEGQENKKKFQEKFQEIYSTWLNIAYTPSDFNFFYDRLRIFFGQSLISIFEESTDPLPQVAEIKLSFDAIFSILERQKDEIDFFPLMNFVKIDYDKMREAILKYKETKKETNIFINPNVCSTYLYYLLKNSNFIYQYITAKETSELKQCYIQFTDFLLNILKKTRKRKKLFIYFQRFQFLFKDISDKEFNDKAKNEYNLILSNLESNHQTIRKIKLKNFVDNELQNPKLALNLNKK